MNQIQSALLSLLPPRRKTTPSGWISINAVCCHHRGQTQDNRGRGGVFIKPDGGWTYHCFNCNFRTGWTPGHYLSSNARYLFAWLGLGETDVQRLNLEAVRLRQGLLPAENMVLPDYTLEPRELPDNSQPIDQWLEDGCRDPELLSVVEYILNRGMKWHWYPWHWSPEPGYRDRVILPFYHESQTVGWTGRKITPGRPRYLTHAQPGYVFNLDRQTPERKFVLVMEGQFDAIALDGVAIMTSEPNAAQVLRIRSLGRQVIALPDQDRAGLALARTALTQGWAVSFPDWEPDVKDAADAVQKYGRLYTLQSVLRGLETQSLRTEIRIKQLEHRYEKQKH